ncbi:3-dehydroquinate synthase [Desulfobulbus rhabdoformis]|jgi:3-dehydroquinate synthase|uniref:3-dehydroquinate synthase n=1 Tax=Desulfobulbus rhabdoformis TaxID=34032 RepID=UPI0019643ABC|nr:3-dehydroquinate synthase [Desulfobulbus rhabdoformis]MBM9615390.1 3-dehydroquinate synthase [Desulfobulbus rhabdoformis]
MEQTIEVGLGERSYPICIGSKVLAQIGPALQDKQVGKRYAIISDDQVAALYGEALLHSLTKAGLACELITFPHGEASKNLATIGQLASALAEQGFDRKDALIALGGGVTGDITGFLAAIYMRGIPFVQVPTTLLAQVDSSVGGKTGVDIPQGKNLIGCFYQPQAVFIDTDVLSTLPREEFLGGMAEVIKYGASIDAEFFTWLGENRPSILALDATSIIYMVRRCCEMKADVVEQDEREGGLRRILNFGHTIGHAVEAASGYQLIHGFAVAIGMQAVAELAVRAGIAPLACATAINELLLAYELPVTIPKDYSAEALRGYLQTDKKTVGGRVFFVLPEGVGKVRITDAIAEVHLDAVLAGQPLA